MGSDFRSCWASREVEDYWRRNQVLSPWQRTSRSSAEYQSFREEPKRYLALRKPRSYSESASGKAICLNPLNCFIFCFGVFFFNSQNRGIASLIFICLIQLSLPFSLHPSKGFSQPFLSFCFFSLSNSMWELSKRWSHSPLVYGVDRLRSTGQLSGSSTGPSNRSKTERGTLWVMKMLVADVGVQRVWASPLGLLCMPNIQSYILSTARSLQCAPFCSADLAWRGNARELGFSCPADMATHQSPGRKQLQVRFHGVIFECSWLFWGYLGLLFCLISFFFFLKKSFALFNFFDMLCILLPKVVQQFSFQQEWFKLSIWTLMRWMVVTHSNVSILVTPQITVRFLFQLTFLAFKFLRFVGSILFLFLVLLTLGGFICRGYGCKKKCPLGTAKTKFKVWRGFESWSTPTSGVDLLKSPDCSFNWRKGKKKKRKRRKQKQSYIFKPRSWL